jgi:hypothetical protein
MIDCTPECKWDGMCKPHSCTGTNLNNCDKIGCLIKDGYCVEDPCIQIAGI